MGLLQKSLTSLRIICNWKIFMLEHEMTIEERLARNREAIKKAISSLETVNYESVARLIPMMLAEKSLELDASVYTAAHPHEKYGVGRYLIYDHKDEKNPVSIWVFAFAPQQKTSIHDHKYRGTVTVLQGILSEKFYIPTEDQKAVLCARFDRYRFHMSRDEGNDNPPKVHQLKYRKQMVEAGSVAVSLHIYEMPAFQKDSKIVNRNILSMFTKKPSTELKPDYQSLKLRSAL